MDAKDIIIKLKDINASIEVVEGKIRLSGDQDMLSKELIDEVAKNKHKLISMLSSVVANKNLLAHDAEDVFPLTTTQRRFWILDKLMSNHSSYNMPVAWDINGALDHNALRRAFLMLAARHESLRTIVEEREDEPFQRVLKIEAFRLDFEYIDGSSDPEDVAKLLREYAADKFVLTKGPLFSVKVFRIADQNHVLFFNVHHICCDGWSFDIILKDIVRLYESAVRDDGGIEPLKYQYRDFVRWQIDRLNDKKVAAQKLFWAEYMSGDLKTLNLPLDRKRSVEGNFHGEQVSFTFSPQLFISLQSLCKKEGCTVFALLVAAVNVLFFRYSGNNDIVTGTPIAGRDRHEFFDIVGLFINTAVIRCKMQPAMPFRELLRNVWQDVMAISQNQDYPFDALVSDLTTTRDDTRNPLFDVLIMHRSLNTVSTKGKTDNGTSSLGVSPFKFAPKVSKLDMSLDFATTDSGLFVDIEFNSTLFDRDRIERMCMHLETLLQGIAEQPDMPLSHVPIIPFSEKILIEKFRGRKKQINLPDNLADLLRLSCETNGRRTALTYQSSVMSYDQLETLVSKQATWLRNVHGIRREDVVAVSMERSDKAFVTMLAIMRAGGIYLPIDRDFPVDRIQYILGDADAKLLIADRALVPRYVDVSKIWNEIESTTIDLIKDEPIPELAYLIYTSGSTGKPKGVLVGHAACLNAVVTQTEELELSNRDVVLQFASMSFDASVIEFFTALCAGSTIDIVPTELRSATTALVDFMKTRGVTFVTFPPSFLRSFPVGTFNFLGGMITAGERADHSIAVEYAKHIRYYNAYGPTEAAVCTTIHRVSSSDEKFTSISIGHPLYNCFVEIVDKEGLPLPVGCDGEMWISGIGLAKGYVKDEGKTNLNFVKGKDGTLRYHTGDIARWRSDGTIEFQGRNDHQVKIHGFRIEIEEVRVALLAIEGVRDSVVKVSRDELIAYYASDVGIEIEDIKDHLTKTLPRYMIPGNFVRMTSLPYNHSGKIDLDKLPAIGEAKEKQKLRSEDAFVEIWRQVLDLQDYTADENFFERGDSLSATRIRHKLLQELGIDVPLDHFFIYPTIREFISSLQSSNEKELIPIERAPDLQYYPLTAQQKRLWILSVTETSTAQYNISTFTTIHGKVIPDALRSAVIFLQERHEILRANFVIKQGEPYQFISSPNAQKTGFSFIDLSDHHEKVKELELLHNSHSTVEFNLEADILYKITLVKMAAESFQLLFVIHHIIFDGLSNDIFNRDLEVAYEAFSVGMQPGLKPLNFQFRDYAWWQSQKKFTADYSDEQFWLKKLSGSLPGLEMPLDFQRPKTRTYDADALAIDFGVETSRMIRDFCLANQVSTFSFVLSAVHILLYKYTGANDIILGTVVSGRDRPELEDQIGFYVNLLALRNDINENQTFFEFVSDVFKNTRECLDHRYYPFDQLVERIGGPRVVDRHPLFDVVVQLQSERNGAESSKSQKSGSLVFDTPSALGAYAVNELTFYFLDRDSLSCDIRFNTNIFTRDTAGRIAHHLKMVMSWVVSNRDTQISRIQLVNTEELEMIVKRFNPQIRYDAKILPLDERFRQTAIRFPQRTALICDDVNLTYSQLNDLSDSLAAIIMQHPGYRLQSYIGIMLRRSSWIAVSIFAILKAGCAYVPIDPTFPQRRAEEMIEDSSIEILLGHGGCPQDMPTGKWVDVTTANVLHEFLGKGANLPEYLAYVIYTSGSTGRPKGTMITHAMVHYHIRSVIEMFYDDLGDHCRIGLFSNVVFDAFVHQFFSVLLNGHTLAMISDRDMASPAAVMNFLSRNSVQFFEMTPSLTTIFGNDERNQSLDIKVKKVMLGGDRLQSRHIASLRKAFGSTTGKQIQIINSYGPTEVTVASSIYKIAPNAEVIDDIPIGTPMRDKEMYIVNSKMEIQPVGVRGEIVIGGPGVMLGYLNRPELTNEKLVTIEVNGISKLVYRSGDVGKWLPDGNITFGGRIDRQIKIRGHRIELGEIEKVITDCKDVSACVVTTYKNNDDLNIIAFVVLTAGEIDEIKSTAMSLLPSYMIPVKWTRLDKLPIAVNGKLDYRSLPMPDPASLQEDNIPSIDRPLTSTEAKMKNVWDELLHRRCLVTDDFFEIGGNSLKALQLCSMIWGALRKEIQLNHVFDCLTIEKLAQFIDTDEDNREAPFVKEFSKGKEKSRIAIFLFPPIVGFPFVFSELAKHLEDHDCYAFNFQHHAAHLPTFAELADLCAHEVLERNYRDVILIGYSAGGVTAFETVKIIDNKCEKLRLMIIDKDVSKHMIDPKGVNIEMELKRFGIVQPDRATINAVKATLQRISRYVVAGKVKCPVIALEANLNEKPTNMYQWRDHASGDFAHRYIMADHFTILKHPGELVSLINKWIEPNV